MMMPANFSAVAETEMTYVVGGASLFEGTPLATFSTLFTNIVNIIGNTFVQPVVNATLGQVFGGTYKFGNVSNGIGTKITGYYDAVDGGFNGVLNAGAQVLGGMAAVAQLMNNDVKVYTKENVVKVNG